MAQITGAVLAAVQMARPVTTIIQIAAGSVKAQAHVTTTIIYIALDNKQHTDGQPTLRRVKPPALAAMTVPDGPLAAIYSPGILRVFFNSNFQGEQEHQDFLTGMLSPESFKVFKRKLSDVFREFDQLSELDSRNDQNQTEGFWLYAGIRPWAPIDVIREINKGESASHPR
jgi:hypothetical protein